MNDQNEWELPPPLLDLADGAVHVWRVDLDAPGCDADALRRTLSPDEVARAERFVFARDRERYVIGRGLLRTILARYTGGSPGGLRFGYNPHGKPFLIAQDNRAPEFNLSHSGRHALVAVSQRRQVGVDIEHIRESIEYEPIAADMFSATEREVLYSTPAPLRRQAFFACWTCKEAYIKARGQGLAIAMNQFDTRLPTAEPAAIIQVADSAEDQFWSLRALHPAQGYVAAVVAEGALTQLRLYDTPTTH